MNYDIGIIGGGPGGYSAAFEAAKHGLSVVLFEADKLGGTCLNRGCIPTKYLSHISKIHSLSMHSQNLGLSLENKGIDFEKIQHKKETLVKTLREQLEKSLLSFHIHIIHEKAFVKEPGSIICGENTYHVKNTIIAIGAKVKEPLTDDFYNSDGILNLKELPRTMKITGGGVIAVEFAMIFRDLGVDVKLQTRSPRILRAWSRETAVSLTRLLKENGIKVETNCDAGLLQNTDAELCLSAIGMFRDLSSMDSSLFKIGETGGIIVNEYGETTCPAIYAIGDITEGSSMLAHHAMEDGKRAVSHILHQELPARSKPVKCIYTHPEAAEAGYSEEQAKAELIPYVTVKAPLYSNSMNMVFGGERSYIRLIAEKNSGKLIGAQMLCERASDLISELALAIHAKIPVSTLCSSVRPHPSFSEGITSALELLNEKL